MFAYCANTPSCKYDPSGYAFKYTDTINRCLSGSFYSNVGGSAIGVSSASPSGGPDGFPISIGGLLQSILELFKNSDESISVSEQKQTYNYNGLKNEKYVSKRGWTDEMIQYAIKNGQQGSSINMANNSSCTVYKYPGTSNQYVVIDDSTGSIVQVSNFSDSGWIVDPRIQWAP